MGWSIETNLWPRQESPKFQTWNLNCKSRSTTKWKRICLKLMFVIEEIRLTYHRFIPRVRQWRSSRKMALQESMINSSTRNHAKSTHLQVRRDQMQTRTFTASSSRWRQANSEIQRSLTHRKHRKTSLSCRNSAITGVAWSLTRWLQINLQETITMTRLRRCLNRTKTTSPDWKTKTREQMTP